MKGQPEPVFYADENLSGPNFVSSLRTKGRLDVRAGVFPEGTLDVVWIPEIAKRGWIAITQDQLKGDLEEQVALVLHGAKVFVLIGRATHLELADRFLRKIRWVRRLIAERDEAFLAKIYVKGGATAVVTLARTSFRFFYASDCNERCSSQYDWLATVYARLPG